eukprot:2993691-Amphidinium_carterae.1
MASRPDIKTVFVSMFAPTEKPREVACAPHLRGKQASLQPLNLFVGGHVHLAGIIMTGGTPHMCMAAIAFQAGKGSEIGNGFASKVKTCDNC